MDPLSWMELTVALLAGAIVAFLLWVGWQFSRSRPSRNIGWAQVVAAVLTAKGASFRPERDGTVRGTVSGRVVTIRRNQNAGATITVGLNLPVAEPRSAADDRGGDVAFGSRWVRLRNRAADPKSLPAAVAEALALARAAEDQATAPWAVYALQYGLRFHSNVGPEPCFIEGELEGVSVCVQLDGIAEPPVSTVITAELPRPLPTGMRLRRRSPDSPQAHLGDPALDQLVQVVGVPTAAARGVIGAMGIQPELKAVMRGCQDAEVNERAVRIRLPGIAGEDLADRIAKAVALARALARVQE